MEKLIKVYRIVRLYLGQWCGVMDEASKTLKEAEERCKYFNETYLDPNCRYVVEVQTFAAE